jgi:hypothetical protein
VYTGGADLEIGRVCFCFLEAVFVQVSTGWSGMGRPKNDGEVKFVLDDSDRPL